MHKRTAGIAAAFAGLLTCLSLAGPANGASVTKSIVDHGTDRTCFDGFGNSTDNATWVRTKSGSVKVSCHFDGNETNWPAQFLKAGYNWQFVNNDGSKGVHNAPFAVGLLKASIADLSGDANNDTLPDWWQVQYFGSSTNVNAAPNATPAGDGVPNWLKVTSRSPRPSVRWRTPRRNATATPWRTRSKRPVGPDTDSAARAQPCDPRIGAAIQLKPCCASPISTAIPSRRCRTRRRCCRSAT